MKQILLMCVLIVFTPLTACSSVKHNIKISDNGIAIDCNINKIKALKYKEDEIKRLNITSNTQSFVYGVLNISNTTTRTIRVNIDNYKLLYGNKVSSRVYMDSVANMIISSEELAANGHLSKKVYWVFPGEISPEEIKMLKLYIQKNE